MSQSISEPILAAASASILHSRGDLKQDVILHSLEKLNDCFRKGLANPGPNGCIVACLLLILGWDQATLTEESPTVAKTIYLQSFFKSLLSKVAYNNLKKKFKKLDDARKALLNYIVFFTHFIEVT
jgi:hypothetical protein